MKLTKTLGNLDYFWNLLTLLGINCGSELQTGSVFKKHRYILIFVIAVVCVSSSAFFYINYCLAALCNLRVKLTSTSLLVSAVGCYLSLFRNKNNLTFLKKQMKTLSARKKTPKVLIALQFTTLLSLKYLFMPAIYVILYESYPEFYVLFSFQNEYVKRILAVTGVFLSYFTSVVFPILLSCIFCAICYSWQEIISSTKDEVKEKGKHYFNDPSQVQVALLLLKKCQLIWEITNILKETFESFLFYMFFTQMVFMYIFAAFSLKTEFMGSKIDFIFYMVCFTSSLYTAALIPQEMEKLVKALKILREERVFETNQEWPETLKKRFKLIIKKEPIALSIGGFADMKKNLIIATFGALITYGVLLDRTIDKT